MLHARKDYNDRIQDADNKIPADEPVFMLRGQDKFAPVLLDIYAALVATVTSNSNPVVVNTKEHAISMREWQHAVKCKIADMDDADSVYR